MASSNNNNNNNSGNMFSGPAVLSSIRYSDINMDGNQINGGGNQVVSSSSSYANDSSGGVPMQSMVDTGLYPNTMPNLELPPTSSSARSIVRTNKGSNNSSGEVTGYKKIAKYFSQCSLERACGFTLFLFLGFMPYLLINTFFSELSLLNKVLPEHKELGATVGFVYEIGYFGPLLYILFQILSKKKGKNHQQDKTSLMVMVILGFFNMLFLGLYWDRVSYDTFGSGGTSLALFILVCFNGFIGSTAYVLAYGFMAAFDTMYLPALSVGLGGSGLITAILSFIQGTGDHPRISVNAFIFICTGVNGISIICAFILMYTKWADRFKWTSNHPHGNGNHGNDGNNNINRHLETPLLNDGDGENGIGDDNSIVGLRINNNNSKTINGEDNDNDSHYEPPKSSYPKITTWSIILVVKWVVLSSFLNSAMSYLIVPGFNTYIAHSDQKLVQLLSNGWLFGNVGGRAISIFYRYHRLEVLNGIQAISCLMMLISIWVPESSSYASAHPMLMVFMIVFAAAAGYTNTMFYSVLVRHRKLLHFARFGTLSNFESFSLLGGNAKVDGTSSSASSSSSSASALNKDQQEVVSVASKWVAFVNQIGSIVGTFICYAIVKTVLKDEKN